MPLLLGEREFAARTIFDAACRLARIAPNVRFEGSAPHTLAALAEAGHGIAIVPGTLKFKSNRLQISRLQFNGEPVVLALAVHWQEQRPLPQYARDFPTLFAAHVKNVLRGPKSDKRGV